jgi:hypothetical protein
MDGTIANFYGVEGWLNYLQDEDTTPYSIAKPLVNMSLLARYLNKLQSQGHEIGIISWGSKHGSDEFLVKIGCAKFYWLNKHLPSVNFNYIKIEHYGTNKLEVTGGGILFDDEKGNRDTWGEGAYEPEKIFEILNNLIKAG